MNKHKLNLLIVINLFFVFVYCGVSLAAGQLDFIISSDKVEYTDKEPIKISFKLINISKKEVYVNKRFFVNSKEADKRMRDVYFEITAPSGEALVFKPDPFEAGLPKSDYFVLLKPKEEIASEREMVINQLFELKELGLYKVTAVYENTYGGELGLDTVKERIFSVPLSISIVEQKEKAENE